MDLRDLFFNSVKNDFIGSPYWFSFCSSAWDAISRFNKRLYSLYRLLLQLL